MEKVLNQTPMNMIELAEELKKIKKREGELSFRSNKTEEYLHQFVHLKLKDAKELYKAIEKLKKSGCDVIYLKDYIKKNPNKKNVKIIG